jgi:hypothetical protein
MIAVFLTRLPAGCFLLPLPESRPLSTALLCPSSWVCHWFLIPIQKDWNLREQYSQRNEYRKGLEAKSAPHFTGALRVSHKVEIKMCGLSPWVISHSFWLTGRPWPLLGVLATTPAPTAGWPRGQSQLPLTILEAEGHTCFSLSGFWSLLKCTVHSTYRKRLGIFNRFLLY